MVGGALVAVGRSFLITCPLGCIGPCWNEPVAFLTNVSFPLTSCGLDWVMAGPCLAHGADVGDEPAAASAYVGRRWRHISAGLTLLGRGLSVGGSAMFGRGQAVNGIVAPQDVPQDVDSSPVVLGIDESVSEAMCGAGLPNESSYCSMPWCFELWSVPAGANSITSD